MKPITIPDSERLSYRLLDSSDLDLMWHLDQDEEVMRYINGGKTTSREDMETKMLPRMTAYRNPEKGWGLWHVSRQDNQDFLGWILIRPMNFFNEKRDDSDLEIGWRFYRKDWGFGYATEAARAIMNAIYQQDGITQFSAIVMEENHASKNIMKKLGMSYDKTELYDDPMINTTVEHYTIKNFSDN